MPRLFIPPQLRVFVGGCELVEAPGGTLGAVVADVERRFPGFRARICVDDQIRPGLAISIDGRFASLGLLQPVAESAEVHFLPAVGGG
ncbi:MAG: MoaD/ThiS family protein [Planctomycetota bacterium]